MPSKKGRVQQPWTSVETRELSQLTEHQLAAFAQEKGRTLAGVRGKWWQLGKRAARTWNPAQVQLLLSLHAEKVPMWIIARRVEKPVGATYAKLYRLAEAGLFEPSADPEGESVQSMGGVR